MTGARGTAWWRQPWLGWSAAAVGGVAAAAFAVGFVWLPSVQGDFGASGLWASICRAAGVPQRWDGARSWATSEETATQVVLDRTMAQGGTADASGRGATLALQQCSMCHSALGATHTDAPNLAGQYREVVIKQLTDYQRRDRSSAIMQAMAGRLSTRDIADLAAYYAALPKPSTVSAHSGEQGPALVTVGDPMRNVAPCASCHGEIDHKLGAPSLEGLPKAYLATQLTGFATGSRHNDSHAQMRNMARQLSTGEIDALAGFYANR